ncbi:MAG: type I phosphomannose isomerase catalytic subunit, partial [Candidatus Izemoplasmataceae bacterium]
MPYSLKPVLKSKMWGGEKLKHLFNFESDLENIGECWGISGYEESESVLLDGPYAGKTLSWLWKKRKDLFGHHESKEFPILVKLIDAADDLSIQVHPDDAYAKKHENSFGKAECWYILDADEKTEIIIGHKAKTYDEFKQYVEANKFEALVNQYPVQKGDTFHIEPGTIHAIKKGTVLLEIQQSSDVTYRFYDYDRLFNGEKRPLHLKEAMDVVKIPDDSLKRGLDTKYFHTDRITEPTRIDKHPYGHFLAVTEGEVTINDKEYPKGTFLVATNEETLAVDG